MPDKLHYNLRRSIGIDGLVSTFIGIAILFLPNISARAAAGMIGAALITVGLFKSLYLFKSGLEKEIATLGNLIVSIIYIGFGIFILIDIQSATISLILIIGILTGLAWLVEGFLRFVILTQVSTPKIWLIISASISILGGVFFLFSPIFGKLIVWTFFGVSLSINGIFKLVQYFNMNN